MLLYRRTHFGHPVEHWPLTQARGAPEKSHFVAVFFLYIDDFFYVIVQQILAEGSPDEVFAQVSNIFEHLPNRKSTSLHDYDVTFITGITRNTL